MYRYSLLAIPYWLSPSVRSTYHSKLMHVLCSESAHFETNPAYIICHKMQIRRAMLIQQYLIWATMCVHVKRGDSPAGGEGID